MQAMRRALLGALAMAIVVSGCGSSSAGSPVNPLSSELSYFPAQSPLVVTAQTGTNSESAEATKALESKIPIFGAIEKAELARLPAGINYDRDIKPLAGNPAAFGDTGNSGTAPSQFLLAWMTRSASKLDALVHKFHLRKVGSHDGASLYGDPSGASFAVDGPTLLIASARSTVTAALDRHANKQGITEAQHSTAITGLDPNAAVQVFGDLRGVLSAPSAAKARRIPWVAAIRSYGVAISASSTALTVSFRLDTQGRTLTASQLPIAAGSGSPSLVKALLIQAGIHDPAQAIQFIEAAEQATAPKSYAQFLHKEARLRRRTGVDVSKLIGDLNGDLIISSDSRTTLARVNVADPETVSADLTKLASVPGVLPKGRTLTRIGPSTFSDVENGRKVLLGLVGSELVVEVPPKGAVASPATLKSFAAAPAAPVPGQTGAVSFRLKLPELITLVSKHPPSAMGRSLLALLGDLTGSVSATPAALTGTATLAIK